MNPMIIYDLKNISRYCPTQWEGKTKGVDGEYNVYIRYRGNNLTIRADKDDAVNGKLVFDCIDPLADESCGIMPDDRLRELTKWYFTFRNKE
jgi:hypothetical protein